MVENRKRYAQTSGTHGKYLLHDVCGTWISKFGSPDIEIFNDGKRFWLTLKYKLGAAFTLRLKKNQGHIFFDFYGYVLITYDQDNDLLHLSTEGDYSRFYES